MAELVEQVVQETANCLRVEFPEVGGGYALECSWVLVQAFGTCCGVDFYFRAKYGEWEFETENGHGHPFPEGDPRRFVLREVYDEAKPNAMSVEWAARIIRRCLAKFWA